MAKIQRNFYPENSSHDRPLGGLVDYEKLEDKNEEIINNQEDKMEKAIENYQRHLHKERGYELWEVLIGILFFFAIPFFLDRSILGIWYAFTVVGVVGYLSAKK